MPYNASQDALEGRRASGRSRASLPPPLAHRKSKSTVSSPASASRPPANPARHTSLLALPAYTPDSRDDMDPLAPPRELRELAYNVLTESFERRSQGLVELRKRLRMFQDEQRAEKDGGAEGGEGEGRVVVKFHRGTDEFLIVFLRAKKFRVEAAFKEYLNFSRAHTEHQWLGEVDVGLVEELFSSESFQVLPGYNSEGRVILSMNVKRLLPIVERLGTAKTQILLAAIFAMIELLMSEMRAQICGTVIVADLAECKLKTFGYLNVSQYLLSLNLCQHCYPLRASGMYIVNEPWYVRGLFHVIRPFMKASVKKNLQCFGTAVGEIHKYISKDLLGPAYGGSLHVDNTLQTKLWVDAVRKRFS